MDSCGCIYVGVDEISETLCNLNQRAFVERRCCECRRTIEKGEDYEYCVSEYDDEITAWITCDDCLSIRDTFFCGEWFWGMVIEYLNNHIDDMQGQISSECILALTPKARERVFNLIEEAWDEIELDEAEGI